MRMNTRRREADGQRFAYARRSLQLDRNACFSHFLYILYVVQKLVFSRLHKKAKFDSKSIGICDAQTSHRLFSLSSDAATLKARIPRLPLASSGARWNRLLVISIKLRAFNESIAATLDSERIDSFQANNKCLVNFICIYYLLAKYGVETIKWKVQHWLPVSYLF